MTKTKLELNDVVYKMRHQFAEQKLVITEVTNMHAIAIGKDGTYKFLLDQLEPIKRISLQFGYTNIFGESYVLGTPENSAGLDRDIQLRFIRNYRFDLLAQNQIDEIQKLLNLYTACQKK